MPTTFPSSKLKRSKAPLATLLSLLTFIATALALAPASALAMDDVNDGAGCTQVGTHDFGVDENGDFCSLETDGGGGAGGGGGGGEGAGGGGGTGAGDGGLPPEVVVVEDWG
ncbi:MAG: hypothetical protein WBL45_00945, partial [Solirubrobacterales bacterium]